MPLVRDPAPGAQKFLPARHTLPVLRAAVPACRGCALHRDATRAVFGEGPANAKIVFVGEVPGDSEDLSGRPFIGPAGRLLDEALEAAGIPRGEVYVTNAVKHFKFTRRGERRLHERPTRYEIAACKPWLAAELEAIQPEIVVALGATAAQSLLGRQFRVTKSRGVALVTPLARWTFATVHPAAVLRAPDAELRQEARVELFRDLAVVGEYFKRLVRAA